MVVAIKSAENKKATIKLKMTDKAKEKKKETRRERGARAANYEGAHTHYVR